MAPQAELVLKSIEEQFLLRYSIDGLVIYDIPNQIKPYVVPDGVTTLVDSRKVSMMNSQDYWTPDFLRKKFMNYVYAITFPGSSIEITHKPDGTHIKSQPVTTLLLECFHLAHMHFPMRFTLEPHTQSAYIAVDNIRLREPFIMVKKPIIFCTG